MNNRLLISLLVGSMAACSVNTYGRDGTVVELSQIVMHDGPSTAIYRVSQDEGEDMLEELSRTYEREDAWVFIDGTSPRWVDIGNKSTVGTKQENGNILYDVATVEVDVLSVLDHIQYGDKGLTFYHTHPNTSFDMSWALYGKSNLTQLLSKATPSPDDFANDVRKKSLLREGLKMLEEEFDYSIRFNSNRVVSPLGIISYRTNGSFTGQAFSDYETAKQKCWSAKSLGGKFDYMRMALQTHGADMVLLRSNISE